MIRPSPRLLAVALPAALLLAACSSGRAAVPGVEVATLVPATSTPPSSATAPSSPTAAISPPARTSPTPTAAATPAAPLALSPPEIPQGGVATIVLYEPAVAATVTFQGRQYPMLREGQRWWAMVGVGAFTEPGRLPVSVSYTPAGRSAPASIVASLGVTKKDFPVEYIELDPETSSLLAPDIVQAEIAQRAAIFAGFTAQRLWSGPFLPPGRGSISSVYGEGRSYNRGPVTDYHRGTDFIGDIGSPAFAAAAGRVVFTGALRVRGNTVIIDHGAGVFTAYNHLSAISTTEGELVGAGQQIGAIGSTGLATGPHLHWEVIVRGVEVDGQLWLQGKEIGP